MAYMDKELYDQIVEESPHLWWWVRDRKNLSTDSVVEGVLSNGDMDDVLKVAPAPWTGKGAGSFLKTGFQTKA